MSELAADGIPVAVTCRVLKLARQPYYRWLANPVTTANWSRRIGRMRCSTRTAMTQSSDTGSWPMRPADAGQLMARRTAWRICSANGWFSVFSKKHRGKNTRPGPPVHEDHVGRNFTASAPNELWLADITEHRTMEGKLYVCAIKDVFSNRIVGYSIDSRMKSRIAVNALNNAVARRGDVAGCIVHTDRGSQFRSRKHIRALSRHGMVGSMGRVGAAGDNAAMESFFALLQNNVLDRRTWTTREELRIAIVTWIERTYHRRRRQDGLGRLTPIQFETKMTTPATQAA